MTLDASTVTTCGSLGTMIGGYGQLGAGGYLEKTFSGLPTHTSLRIRATLFKIDQWASANFEVLLDGAVAWQSASYTSHGDYICGNPGHNQRDMAVDVDVTAAHSGSSATLRFTTTITGSDDFWGLQGVTVQTIDA